MSPYRGAMGAPAVRHLSFDEYLVVEQRSADKHELVGGVMYAMTGGSLRHSMLAGAVHALLWRPSLDEGCRPHSSDARLRIGEASYYPDAMVVCGPVVHDQYETAPCLVVEVLSPSTSVIDRRDKLAAYVSIPTLLAYVIVESEQVAVELHQRTRDGWETRVLGPGATLSLRCPKVELSIDALYEGLPDPE